MAILYGTQSNGGTLPVQVNEFGQLVAQGLKGDPGTPGTPGAPGAAGPPGPQGPPGTVTWEQGFFTPVYDFSAGGSAVIDYNLQEGAYFKLGTMVFIYARVSTNNVVITDARGVLRVAGWPSIDTTVGSFKMVNTCVVTRSDRWTEKLPIQARLNENGRNAILTWNDAPGTTVSLSTSDLTEGANTGFNDVSIQMFGQWGGSMPTEIRPIRDSLDELREEA